MNISKEFQLAKMPTCSEVDESKSPNLRTCCETELLSVLLLPTQGFASDPLSL